MDIIIFGGSGFVGQSLAKHLERIGYSVWIASRGQKKVDYGKNLYYTPERIGHLFENMTNDYAIINLAGQSINSGRWTENRKKEILESRIHLTHHLVDAIKKASHKPSLLINASAIGYYGYSDHHTFTEEDKPGEGFLAEVTKQWEETANLAKEYSRVVIARLGVVLGKNGGALPRMAAPYHYYVGGKVGTGKQWLSWVHIEDVCGILHYCIEEEKVEGPVNITAPNPERMDRFGVVLSEALHKPHWLPVPSFMMNLLLGEMSEIVLKGHRVMPEKILQHGYSFKHSTLPSAIKDLLRNKS